MGAARDRGARRRLQSLGSPRGSASRPPAERQLGPSVDDPLGPRPDPRRASAVRWLVSVSPAWIVALPPLSKPAPHPDGVPRLGDGIRLGLLGNPLSPARGLAGERLPRCQAPGLGTLAGGR